MAKERIVKIAILGAESTGKTSLCEALAKQYNTLWVPEYAREYFKESSIYNYTLEDLVLIAKKQIELEQAFEKKAQRLLFCDTTLITLKIWAELEFETVPSFISQQLALTNYAHYFITNNDLPWVQDELRQNKFDRDLILEMNVNEAKKLNGNYSIIAGKESERLRNAIEIIDKLAGG